MQLYLMQHGLSLSKDQDPEQGLSPQGVSQVMDSAEAVKRMGLTFDLVVASTKKRSQETARIVAEAVGYPEDDIVVTDRVKAMTPPEDTIGFLEIHKGKERVFIAGHLPSLSELSSYLMGCKPNAVRFMNAGLVKLECPDIVPGSAKLAAYLAPEHLALLGKG